MPFRSCRRCETWPRISNMDKDDILRKIEKCLALAKSSEPAEAAAALRQAQALMREHGVSQLEAQAIGARECSVKAAAHARRAGTKPTLPALWPMLSAASSSLRAAESSRWSSVAAGRLLAQCRGGTVHPAGAPAADGTCPRRAHQGQVEALRPKNKTARADAFCQGWVAAIASRTPHGVLGRSEGCNRGPHAAESPEPGKFTPRSRDAGARGWADQVAGHRAGAGVQLHQGVGASSAPLMLE